MGNENKGELSGRHTGRVFRAASKALLAAGLIVPATGACTSELTEGQPTPSQPGKIHPAIIEGSVINNASILTEPQDVETEALPSNTCGRVEDFHIPKSFGAIALKPSSNNDWIGIPATTEGLPRECAQDPDHTVWVNEKYFKGTIESKNVG